MPKISTSLTIKPWYKQFWPWVLIFLPFTSICVSSIMLFFAINTEDSVVIDDYYKEGKSINLDLAKLRHASSLGIRTELQVDEESVVVSFLSGAPTSGEALRMAFYHMTQEDKDITLLLTRDAHGDYRATIPSAIQGKWRVSLTPQDQKWKIQEKLILPLDQAFPFNP